MHTEMHVAELEKNVIKRITCKGDFTKEKSAQDRIYGIRFDIQLTPT